MSNPLFDLLNSINYSKEDLFVDEQYEKAYNPYIINKFVAGSMDTVFYAAEMSTRSHLPKNMQYDFYRNIIRSKKRYTKWIKFTEDDIVDSVALYFDCSKRIAREYLTLLSDDEIQRIREKTSRGGKV